MKKKTDRDQGGFGLLGLIITFAILGFLAYFQIKSMKEQAAAERQLQQIVPGGEPPPGNGGQMIPAQQIVVGELEKAEAAQRNAMCSATGESDCTPKASPSPSPSATN
jgi:hypothetical protein